MLVFKQLVHKTIENNRELKRQYNRDNEGMERIRYSQEEKGWRGTSKPMRKISSITQKNETKQRQLADIAKVVLAVNKQNFNAVDVDIDGDDQEDAMSVSESPFDELPIIGKPFANIQGSKFANWRTPAGSSGSNDRQKSFHFDRPLGMVVSDTNDLSPAQRLVRMEQLLGQKERDNDVLRKQLHKAQVENYKIINELKGFKGHDYESLRRDADALRDENERLKKENIRLIGQHKQSQNSVLLKQKITAELERKYGLNNMKPVHHYQSYPSSRSPMSSRSGSMSEQTTLKSSKQKKG